MFSVNLRRKVRDQFWKRGSVSPFGDTAGTPPPFAMVGSMNGGWLMFLALDPRRRVCLEPGGLGIDVLAGRVALPQQERREGIAGLAEVVARGVVAAGLEPIEIEIAGGTADAPALVRELVMPVLEAHLDGALAPDPRQVGGELPAIVLFVPEARPRETEGVVGDVAGEVHLRRARVSENEATLLLGTPQPLRPIRARREAGPAHVPAVPGHGGVAHQVVVDDPVPLGVGVRRVDALCEALADVISILG